MNNERIQAAIADAISQRGPRKGRLKTKCPPLNTDGAAAWQALQTNPWKTGIWHLLCLDEERKAIYNHIKESK